MKDRHIAFVALILFAGVVRGAPTAANFGGEYANKKFLNGKAIFQMSLEQTGTTFSVWFSATYEDGHGAAPEAQGIGKVKNDGMAEFMFQDNFGNTGTATIVRGTNEIVVTMQMKKIVDARCMEFYGPKIHLKPAANR